MAWNNVSKPNSTSYTNVNAMGRQTFNDSSVSFDDPNVFFNGLDASMWTNLNKPSLPSNFVGYAYGLLMPLSKRTGSFGTSWTNINKPI